jgi:chaperonin GroEL (HSP60 family)
VPKIVAGGGAPEMEIARALRGYAETLPGREQLAIRSFSEAIEIVPLTLGENAGLDPISGGKDAQRNNIMAARAIAEAIKSALGPKGMDKMLVDSSGDVTITSDGRTILDKMDIEHPAAKMMVEVAKTQDAEVGDGTTTSVMVAGELLGKAEDLINKGVHPTVIVEGYSKAADKALETLERSS